MLDGHFHAEGGIDIVSDSRPDPVAKVAKAIEGIGCEAVFGDGLLAVEVSLPMLIELIAQDSRETRTAVSVIIPIEVVEISSHRHGEFGGDAVEARGDAAGSW